MLDKVNNYLSGNDLDKSDRNLNFFARVSGWVECDNLVSILQYPDWHEHIDVEKEEDHDVDFLS